VIAAPPVVLIIQRSIDARTIARPHAYPKLYEIYVGLRPLKEVLVLTANVQQARAEL
jgi:hypothetical protein